MNLWQLFSSKKTKYQNAGICFHFEQGIDADLKKEYMAFGRWLRKNYVFPIRVHVYILNREKVRLKNGVMAYGSFRWYQHKNPNIRVPSALSNQMRAQYTKEEIFDAILSSLVHELTHYYQWVLQFNQSNAVSERQANYYRYRILDMYYNK